MKSFLSILSSTLIMAFFTQCGSAQFEKKAPFTINKAYYQDWFGGRMGSKGTMVTIEISDVTHEGLVFDSIFFNEKINKLVHTISDNKQIITGNFPVTVLRDNNIIIHADPREEMANKLPSSTVTFPFELTDNECVISYIFKSKKRFYKIENLKKEKAIYYP